jgi:hypothetical protein
MSTIYWTTTDRRGTPLCLNVLSMVAGLAILIGLACSLEQMIVPPA